MNDIWWVKLATDMFNDEKIRLIEAMPDADTLLIIWVKLLCQAGKTNANGYIFLSRDIPFSDDNLATLFNRPVNTIRLAMTTLQRLNMIKIDEKGAIFITNWGKYQNVEGMEKAKIQNRLRQQKHRQQLLLLQSNVTSRDNNVIVTPLEIDKDIEYKIKNIYTLWNNQNIKNHRKLTDEIKRAINTALKENTEGQISQSIKNYAEIQKGEQYYFKYAWTLKDFLKRGFSKFEDLETAKRNYKKNGQVMNNATNKPSIKDPYSTEELQASVGRHLNV